jgi:Amt family ammonium transporter
MLTPGRDLYFICALLVFFMQVGFLLLETGTVRARDMSGIAIKIFMMLLGSSLAYLTLGYRLMWGESVSGVIGWRFPDLSHSSHSPEWLFYQVGFAAVCAVIISGAIAGRTTLTSNLIASVIIAGLIYPVYGHQVWGNGWINMRLHPHDFAGAGVVHFTGGIASLVGAWLSGRRSGWLVDLKSGIPNETSLPIATVGVLFLWIGWMGFNGGSGQADSVGRYVLATGAAASAGGFAGLGAATIRRAWTYQQKLGIPIRVAMKDRVLFDPLSLLSGAMGGMVAVTAVCDLVDSPGKAILVGVAGGIVTYAFSAAVRHVLMIDDPVDAVAVHAGGGITGILLAPFFSQKVLSPSQPYPVTFFAQFTTLAAGLVWSGGSIGLLFWMMKGKRIDKGDTGESFTGILRCSGETEKEGLSFEPRVIRAPEFPLRTHYLSQELKEDVVDMLAVIAGGPIHSLSDIETAIENNNLKEAKRLLREQIESLKIFSKPLLSVDVDLSSLVSEVLGTFNDDRPEIRFLPTSGITARGQRDLLRIAIRALVSNAVKAASDAHPPGRGTATVNCTLTTDGIWAYLRIGDNGPGVPDRIQRRLFKPFNIGASEGHGLGLFLAEFIAETFHGGIQLVRNVRDQGATFELSLPVHIGR